MRKPFIHYLSLFFFTAILLIFSCNMGDGDSNDQKSGDGSGGTSSDTLTVDIQGHRGARGVLPENSIEGFVYALEQGVTTLELDVVISKDGQVVVSHEPWMSADICLHVGDSILNIYEMNYAQVRSYDCGIMGNERFPGQKKISTYKPKLTEVFQTIEEKIQKENLAPVMYNIETKSTPEGDGVFHPVPQEFAQTLYNVIAARGMKKRVTIQSFDVRTLQAMKEIDASIPLVLLISEKQDRGLEKNLQELGFIPAIYSPEYTLVDANLVKEVHAKGMKLIPWTVNDSTDVLNLLNLGVDGIITDYPELGVSVAKGKN